MDTDPKDAFTALMAESRNTVIFTGVAGAINSKLKQWDIIIPHKLIQHDMDARPLFKRYEIPALKTCLLYTSPSPRDS